MPRKRKRKRKRPCPRFGKPKVLLRATAATSFKAFIDDALAHCDFFGAVVNQLGEAVDGKNGLGQIARRLSLQTFWPRVVHSLHQHLVAEFCIEPVDQVVVNKRLLLKHLCYSSGL